jgi:hypothetical protein
MKKNEVAISQRAEPLELVYSKQTKIKQLDEHSSISTMINYLYVLLNIKKDNQLNEIEESVLNGFILSNYQNYTTDEIKHAFRLAVAGKLQIDMYQKLDSVTFGKVLVNYNKFKQLKIKEYTMSKKVKKTIPTKIELTAIEAEFIKNCVLPYIEERKELKEPKIDFGTLAIFDYFWKRKSIKLTKKEIAKYKDLGNKAWIESLKKRRSLGERINIDEPMGNRTSKLYSSCIALYDKIDDIIELEKITEMGWDAKQ